MTFLSYFLVFIIAFVFSLSHFSISLSSNENSFSMTASNVLLPTLMSDGYIQKTINRMSDLNEEFVLMKMYWAVGFHLSQ